MALFLYKIAIGSVSKISTTIVFGYFFLTSTFSKKLIYPDILLVPLVAFDKNLNRLGYGGGYYDRVINKLSKKKDILKIGLALSVQKINNVPVTKYDKKLDYIVTDKYIL